MIDFHSHILPCVDDGSKSLEQSLEMLCALSAQGVKTVVATPHFYADDERLEEFLKRRSAAYEGLKGAMNDSMPRVLLGAEVRFYSGIENLSDVKRLCIEGTNVLLLEMPFSKWSGYTLKEVIELSTMRNVTVVLAHIDRYLSFQDKEVWSRLLDNDILMQVNAAAFKGPFSRARTMEMLRSGMIHLIGTDCHNMSDRAPNMKFASDKIVKKFGDGFMAKFTKYGNKILNI